jgi:hypothetical protein
VGSQTSAHVAIRRVKLCPLHYVHQTRFQISGLKKMEGLQLNPWEIETPNGLVEAVLHGITSWCNIQQGQQMSQ